MQTGDDDDAPGDLALQMQAKADTEALEALKAELRAEMEKSIRAEMAAEAKAKAAKEAKARKGKAKDAEDAPEPAGPHDGWVKIQLENADDIPPNGLFVGVNGVGHVLTPGIPLLVPPGVVEVLRNAVMATPMIDPRTRQVMGYRDQMKYNFRIL